MQSWNAAAPDWLPLATQLTASGFEVFAVYLPGHGATRRRASSLPRLVRALERIEYDHGPFDVWIAHSMGANAALRSFARSFGLSATATEPCVQAIEKSEAMRLADLDTGRNAAG